MDVVRIFEVALLLSYDKRGHRHTAQWCSTMKASQEHHRVLTESSDLWRSENGSSEDDKREIGPVGQTHLAVWTLRMGGPSTPAKD